MSKELLGPDGKPIHKERKLIVIKTPRGVNLDPQLYGQISAVTGCAVIQLPMTCEVMDGDLAAKELESLHTAIHAINNSPAVEFSGSDLSVLYSALRFLCEKTQPGDKSKEVALLKQIKQVLPQ